MWLPLPPEISAPAEAREPAEAEAREPAEPAIDVRFQHRVVVVDDNVDAATSLAEILERWGCSVRVAHDGATGIQAALQHRPSLLLLDIDLPDLSGYDVARRLRAELNPRPFVVAVTGFGQPCDKERAEQAGFDRHIVKPMDLETLKQLLQRPT